MRGSASKRAWSSHASDGSALGGCSTGPTAGAIGRLRSSVSNVHACCSSPTCFVPSRRARRRATSSPTSVARRSSVLTVKPCSRRLRAASSRGSCRGASRAIRWAPRRAACLAALQALRPVGSGPSVARTAQTGPVLGSGSSPMAAACAVPPRPVQILEKKPAPRPHSRALPGAVARGTSLNLLFRRASRSWRAIWPSSASPPSKRSTLRRTPLVTRSAHSCAASTLERPSSSMRCLTSSWLALEPKSAVTLW